MVTMHFNGDYLPLLSDPIGFGLDLEPCFSLLSPIRGTSNCDFRDSREKQKSPRKNQLRFMCESGPVISGKCV